MPVEQFDLVVNDRVQVSAADKLKRIGTEARSMGSAVDRASAALGRTKRGARDLKTLSSGMGVATRNAGALAAVGARLGPIIAGAFTGGVIAGVGALAVGVGSLVTKMSALEDRSITVGQTMSDTFTNFKASLSDIVDDVTKIGSGVLGRIPRLGVFQQVQRIKGIENRENELNKVFEAREQLRRREIQTLQRIGGLNERNLKVVQQLFKLRAQAGVAGSDPISNGQIGRANSEVNAAIERQQELSRQRLRQQLDDRIKLEQRISQIMRQQNVALSEATRLAQQQIRYGDLDRDIQLEILEIRQRINQELERRRQAGAAGSQQQTQARDPLLNFSNEYNAALNQSLAGANRQFEVGIALAHNYFSSVQRGSQAGAAAVNSYASQAQQGLGNAFQAIGNQISQIGGGAGGGNRPWLNLLFGIIGGGLAEIGAQRNRAFSGFGTAALSGGLPRTGIPGFGGGGFGGGFGGGGFGFFNTGGYTGNGSRSGVAGLVHGQEYVINAAATARHRQLLEHINAGGSGGPSVVVENHSNAVVDVVPAPSTGEVRLLIRQELATHGPRIMAQQVSNPNSRTSKALNQHTNAGRRR